ncbi:MAG: serine/threonine protein kinase, partial [Gemmatimonadetes bacterium]|nr:serine/threonine protein kinase [Gemmatimonadota bacterium]
MADPVERLKTALADRYAIEREIGQGGMATVYLAEDVKHHRKVAVKVLRPELAAVLGADRFLREIDIAAKLQHPHILTLIDSGEADGFLYYVMPFVDGESLRSKLARERELPMQEAVRIIREVVDALVNAHAIGVVHRDIKPDNVLLSGRHAVVTDFGIAKAVSEATGAQQITTAGVALGTPAYMAPEQAVADPNVDHRADIYAVGVMAYEMLAGEPPFAGANPQAVLSAHVTETPKAVTESRTTVSPELGAVIMKCLEKKPADRWQSAEELHVELEKLTTPSGGTAPVTAVTTAPARRRGVVTAAIAAGVVLAVAGFFALRGGGSPTVIASGDRLVVIPFAPTNEDSALSRLGRDLVVLLTRNLDGVGDIEVVDHTTVLAKTGGGGSDRRYSLTEAAEIGRQLGAATVLHGTLLRVGDQVVLDVGWFETDGLKEIARASAQAPVNEHF